MERSIHQHLENWSTETNRKVLLLRGARQVGKTYSVRELGKKFEYFLEVNFESDRSIHHFFQGDLDVDEICQNLGAFYNIPVRSGKTLLFFDEIQACTAAVSSLRFFQEKKPDLHVIAAGSLLEFALQDLPSFGVGRIQFLYMYPMSFSEFLLAKGEQNLLKLLLGHEPQQSFNEAFHNRILRSLKEFLFVGGLPEVVQSFVQTKDLRQVMVILDRLINGFEEDFAKYKRRVPSYRLREVFQAVTKQSGSKFILSKASEHSGLEQIKDSLHLLEMAGLVYKVRHSSAVGIPLGARVDNKKFKVLMFDHGVFQRILGLEISDYLLAESFDLINKGNLAELFAGLELIKYCDPRSRPQLFYWHREKRGSMAEVDYLVQRSDKIIPIEIKSGTRGKMQSLWKFMEEKDTKYGVRCSLENFSQFDDIQVFPLYAMMKI